MEGEEWGKKKGKSKRWKEKYNEEDERVGKRGR